MKKYLLLILLASYTNAFADWTKIPTTDFTISPPPAEGSAEYIADFKTLHDFQDNRTKEQCDMAREQEHISFDAFYADAQVLSKKELSRSRDLVKKAMKLGERVSVYFKTKFMRPRPYTVDKTLKPCINKPGGSKSYPSGHAISSAVSACVLAIIYPNISTELLALGKLGGDLRVIAGVHHPSDVVAGQNLAAQICERLSSESDFMEAVEDVQ